MEIRDGQELPHCNDGDSSPLVRTPLTDSEMTTAVEALRQRVGSFSRRVVPVYKALEWVWGVSSLRIPTQPDIARALHEIIDCLRVWPGESHKARVESGGLYAEIEREPEGDVRASLGFCDYDSTWLSAEPQLVVVAVDPAAESHPNGIRAT